VPRPLAGGDTTPVADTSSLALVKQLTKKRSLDVYSMLVFGSPKRW